MERSLCHLIIAFGLVSGICSAQEVLGPYSYDPSWGIDYSEGVFHYYPRDRKASTYKIPSSIKLIEERAFQCNHYLTEISIPEGVYEIGLGAFLWSKKLRTVTIKGPVKTIPWRAFEDCPELRVIDLPATITTFDGQSFSGCKKMERIIIRNPEPPELFPRSADDDPMWDFWGVDLAKCVVYVPKGSVDKYKNADGWKCFKNIKEIQ